MKLDRETLEFAIKISWQQEFSSHIGKTNQNKRAEAIAHKQTQRILQSYLDRLNLNGEVEGTVK